MTGGYRRGIIFGGQFAQHNPDLIATKEALELFASVLFASLKQQGYAHIEPCSEFIVGFVHGFGTARAFRISASRPVEAA